MGGNLSVSQRNELLGLASVATNALANAQALDLGELPQPATAVASAAAAAAASGRGAKKSKHQCRWCLETFEKKWNKDRHEARKHESELEAALAAGSGAMGDHAAGAAAATEPPEAVSGRKRKGSVTLESHTPHPDADSELAAATHGKRARVGEGEKSDDEDAPADATAVASDVAGADEEHTMDGESQPIEAGEHDSTSTEPGEQASDEAIKQQIAALNEELADEEAIKSGDLFDESTRAELQAADAQIAACCLPFLSWLCAPAVTESERLVKARRVDPKQLAPVKKNLAFIIKALLGTNVVQPGQVKLDLFTQEPVCQKLNTFLEERQVGSSRIYALFLLIKKVLVYLSSSESVRRREYIPPNTWNSWTCVDSICSESNTRRKQLSSNRKLLGAEQCKKIEAAPMRAGPTADDLRMPALYGEKKKSISAKGFVSAAASNVPVASSSAMIENASLSVTLQLRADPNELTPAELRRLTQGCLDFLNRTDSRADYRRFVRYLVTATECLAMAPRQQCLRQIQLGSSFVKKDDGLYWIFMLAHMNKNNKATAFPIAKDLTAAYDHYLSVIRPQILGDKDHSYVFCKQNGAPMGTAFDFSDWTKSVCKEVLGRPVNCHAFRSALITTYYKSGATQVQRDALAAVMAHDPTTALNHYFKDDAQQQALEIQERMREAYGLNVQQGSAAASAESEPAAAVQSTAVQNAELAPSGETQLQEDTHMAIAPLVAAF